MGKSFLSVWTRFGKSRGPIRGMGVSLRVDHEVWEVHCTSTVLSNGTNRCREVCFGRIRVLGLLFSVFGFLLRDGKRPRRSWALRWEGGFRDSEVAATSGGAGGLGRDVQGGGLIATAILRPAVLLEKGECGGGWFVVLVSCFRFSVRGWETAQTELGPPMGETATRRSRLNQRGRGMETNKKAQTRGSALLL